ncbi:MAG TPA: MFS transporter [Verrucomicrobiae bacterium]|nr:MFS transporter [Verrucomicrobiae bacterium]
MPEAAPRTRPGVRWTIISLIFFATAINYVDRQSISLLFPVFGRPSELNITPLEYSRIGTVLLLAYMLSQSISGKFYDRYGSRIGFTVSIVLWSLAAMGQSLIVGLGSFAAATFLLGFGEAGNWPGAAKVVAEWFPVRERALGMAIFNSGAALGSVVAPPLIVWLQLRLGWRMAFFCAGTLGLFWLVAWLALYHTPETHPRVSKEELRLIREGGAPRATAQTAPRWRTLLRYRQVWAIVTARFLVDPIWWLFVLWLPEYLSKARGMSLKQIGMFAWAPYLAAAMGSLFGGWLSGRMIAAGASANRARKTVVVLAACLMPAGILAARAESPLTALGFIAIVLFGFQMWISNVQTLPSDFFSDSAVGSVAGLGGTGAAVGSILFTLTTGWVVTHLSYAPVLVVAGLLAPAGTVALLLLAGNIQRLDLGRAAPAIKYSGELQE